MTSIQCQSCGKTISGQSLFCPYCGAKLQPQEATIPAGTVNTASEQDEVTIVAPPPVMPMGSNPSQQTYQAPPQQGYQAPPQQGYQMPPQQGYQMPPQQGYQQPPQKKSYKGLIIALVAVILALAGAGAFFILKNQEEKAEAEQQMIAAKQQAEKLEQEKKKAEADRARQEAEAEKARLEAERQAELSAQEEQRLREQMRQEQLAQPIDGYVEITGTLNGDPVYFTLNVDDGYGDGTFYNRKIDVFMSVAGSISRTGFSLESYDYKSDWVFNASSSNGVNYTGNASNGSVTYRMNLKLL
ncbi:MAG: zinc-ribbon domain-containing protein [Bacteroidaceae bacterium]|nr:zinc-ribbon domain-containing protein [Bacteroidaceae bacterium]